MGEYRSICMGLQILDMAILVRANFDTIIVILLIYSSTEWGYLQTGSGFPKNQLPVISRAIDLDYCMLSCKLPFNITGPPDVQRINKYGGYGIKYDRLAIIDGEADPWRPAGPHADWAPKRKNTIERPFVEIADAVHHCKWSFPWAVVHDFVGCIG